MRKKILISGLFLLLISAAGCQNTSEGSTDVVNESTTKDKQEAGYSFSGTLAEDPTQNNDQDKTFHLFVKDVKEANDSKEDFAQMFQSEGVVLNITEDQLKDVAMSELKKGTQIEVQLTGAPITTMSIPPQMASMSIEYVKKNK